MTPLGQAVRILLILKVFYFFKVFIQLYFLNMHYKHKEYSLSDIDGYMVQSNFSPTSD